MKTVTQKARFRQAVINYGLCTRRFDKQKGER